MTSSSLRSWLRNICFISARPPVTMGAASDVPENDAKPRTSSPM